MIKVDNLIYDIKIIWFVNSFIDYILLQFFYYYTNLFNMFIYLYNYYSCYLVFQLYYYCLILY